MIRCVSVSGGKDSTACALLALEKYPKKEIRLVFADTGNEHETTIDYLTNYLPGALGMEIHTVRADFTRDLARKAEYCRTVWAEEGLAQEKIDRAIAILKPTGNPFLDLCTWKGRFPSRRAQFCTEQLKKFPIEAYQMTLLEEFGEVESWQGIRADESQNRAAKCDYEATPMPGLTIYRPILKWTAQETVDYVRSRGIELNPLYKQGMERVGCMPCINVRKAELLEISRRFPEHVQRIAEWEKLVGDASKRDAATFFVAANLGEETTNEEAYERANILQIVEWSKTGHGGKQYDLFKASTEEPEMCSSAYGLCE